MEPSHLQYNFKREVVAIDVPGSAGSRMRAPLKVSILLECVECGRRARACASCLRAQQMATQCIPGRSQRRAIS